MMREHGILSLRGFFLGSSRCVFDKQFFDARQNLARQRFVGNGTRQCNRAEHGAVVKNGLLPSRRRRRAAEQSGKQSNIAPDLLGVELSRRLTAAAYIADEGADRATGTRIVTMILAKVALDKAGEIVLVRLCWRFVQLSLPASQHRAELLDDKVISRAEMFVEAADRQSGFFHQLSDAEPIDTRLTRALHSNPYD